MKIIDLGWHWGHWQPVYGRLF